MSLDERIASVTRTQSEMCSLNMGSMNFGLYHLLQKRDDWKYQWEPAALEFTRDYVFRNTFKDLEGIMRRMGEDLGTRFEYECYDVGHLYNLAHCVDRRLVQPPLFV